MGFAPYAGHGWATFEVLSKDHSGLLDGLMPHLSDKNQVARCAASAGIIRLSTAKENPKSNCREHGLRNVSEEQRPPLRGGYVTLKLDYKLAH